MTRHPDHPALWRSRTVRRRWRRRRNGKAPGKGSTVNGGSSGGTPLASEGGYRAPCRGRCRTTGVFEEKSSRLVASGRAIAWLVLRTVQRRDTQQLKS